MALHFKFAALDGDLTIEGFMAAGICDGALISNVI
jgi:hypothetical protein